MSFAPPTILAVRKLIQVHVPQLSAIELGIVGDDSHANSGTSYHLGKDAVRVDAYSVDESSRDRNGLSNAASGLDIGYFKIVVKGVTHTLRGFNAWAVAECRAGARGGRARRLWQPAAGGGIDLPVEGRDRDLRGGAGDLQDYDAPGR